MSCSKIFSGDLPELTYDVIKYFQNDYSTLHSCILVNRLWCRLAIPLLWENPFSIRTGKYNFIEVYLYNSNDEFKTKLYEYKIINNSLPSNTLFNYPSFLKYLNTYKYIFFIDKWFEATIKTSNPENISYICVQLFKIFIENQVNLHTLDIEDKYNYLYYRYFNDILKLILQNLNFIHNVRNLNIYIKDSSNFLRIFQAVNLHQNIKKILLRNYDIVCYYQLLLSSKDYNFLNTLNTIIFYKVDFKNIINLDKVFEQLNVLESVHLIYCILDTGFTQQIINLTKPFKLKSLFINEVSQIKSLQLLLQKSGGYLENFVYDEDEPLQHKLLELIIKYCKNINFFSFCEIVLVNYQIINLINLIENIKQNLNYLLITIGGVHCNNSDVEYASFILQNLGQIIPSKLEYLSLNLCIRERDFKAFLENSQDKFINKLIINQRSRYDILRYIKKHIMKEKRVKYLAISRYHGDLFDLKDEVKEFKLHNVIVRSYSDLSIDTIDFIKNID